MLDATMEDITGADLQALAAKAKVEMAGYTVLYGRLASTSHDSLVRKCNDAMIKIR